MELEHLTVTGDVVFGAKVTLKVSASPLLVLFSTSHYITITQDDCMDGQLALSAYCGCLPSITGHCHHCG